MASDSEMQEHHITRDRFDGDRPRERKDFSGEAPIIRLFVKNLSYKTDWKGLRDFFMSKTSNVMFADVIMDETGRSKGMGVVDYQDRDLANRAIAECDGQELDGRTISVREEPYEHTLSINNLPYSIKSRDLKERFAEFGEIIRVYMSEDERGRSKGTGFVMYNSREAIDQAVAKYHETEMDGRKIYVREGRNYYFKVKANDDKAKRMALQSRDRSRSRDRYDDRRDSHREDRSERYDRYERRGRSRSRDRYDDRRDTYRSDDRRDRYEDRRDTYRSDDRRDRYEDRRDTYRGDERRY